MLRVQATNKPKLAIVKFPAGASGPATFTVNVTFPQGMPPASSVLRINDTTNAWTETGVTWSNSPPRDNAFLDTVPMPQAPGDVTFQVGEVSGERSFYIDAAGAQILIEIRSREQGAALGPRLNFGTPPTTTSTTTTTTLPPPNCVKASQYPSVQAAHDATPVGGCLEIDGDYTLTSNFNVTKDIDILCPVAGHGLRTGAGISLMLISASGVTVDGCDLTGNGATTSTAVYLLGSIANVKLDNLLVRSIQTGVVGDSGVQHDMTVEDSTFEDIGGTGTAWYYGQESYNVRILQNTYRRTQRSGVAGQAGIQSGGSPELRHHWTIQGNTVENLTCAANPSGRVDIGLDQIADSVIDHNVVRHCNDYGEGIVVNGPRNQITWNQVYGVRNGSITLINYPSAAQSVHGATVADNLVDGSDLGQRAGASALARG